MCCGPNPDAGKKLSMTCKGGQKCVRYWLRSHSASLPLVRFSARTEHGAVRVNHIFHMQPSMLPFIILAFDILRAAAASFFFIGARAWPMGLAQVLKLEAVTAQTNDLVRDSEDLRAAYRELRDWHGEAFTKNLLRTDWLAEETTLRDFRSTNPQSNNDDRESFSIRGGLVQPIKYPKMGYA